MISVVMVMVSTLPVFLTGASFLQLQSDIELSLTSLGAVTAAFFTTAALASRPLGKLVERLGWRRSMQMNALVSAVVLVLISVVVESPFTLGLLLIVGGMAYGITNPAANLALARGSARQRRGLVFGLKHAGIPASTLVSGAAVPLVVVRFGWRPTFSFSAALALIAWLLIRLEPEARGSSPSSPPEDVSGKSLDSRRLITLALGSACATSAAVSLGTFLVAGAVDASLTESQAGLLLFVGSASSITARVVAGLVVDKRPGTGFSGVAMLMGMGAIALAALSLSQGMLFAVVTVAAFAFGWGWPGLLTFAVVNANPGSPASSTAVTQAGIFLGAGVGPIALGWVIERWSFSTGWLIVSVLLALAALVMLSVVRRTNPSRAE